MSVAYSRVMFLGTAGVGKTCFNRSLRKLPWKPDTSSTIISDVSYIKPFTYQSYTFQKKQWKETTPEDEIEELAQLMVAVHNSNISEPRKVSSSFVNSRSSSNVRKKSEQVTEILSKTISVARNRTFHELESQPFLNFWDCGGQPAFLEILPAFLTPRTMFFLVFDASKPFNTNWQSNYHIKGKRFDGEEVNMTTLDHMLNWMANIHSHLMAYNEDGSVADYPRMFCIGTHGDLLTEEETSKVKGELEGHYREKGYNNLIEGTLIIDNTTSDTENEDPSIHRVREEVLKFTEEKLVKMTPLTWVLFRKVLQVLGVNVISLSTAYDIGAASNIPQEDVPSVLSFYHDLGAVLFYPQLSGLKDKVIINPKYFVDALGKIFSFNLKNDVSSGLTGEVELFHQYGILVEPLYAKVWKSCEDLEPSMFVEVLSHFRLAAQVTTDLYSRSHKQYFIPAVLPLCRDDVNVDLPNDSFCAAPLHITFSTGFVPPGFFTRFAAVLANRSTQIQLLLDEGVYRNRVTFCYKDPNSSSIEHMTISDHHDVIEVDVYRATSGFSPSPPQKVYPNLLSTLKEAANEVEKILKSTTIRKNQKSSSLVWSHVCTKCPPPFHYLTFGPGHQTRESEVSCKKDIRIYRTLKEDERVWFTSGYNESSYKGSYSSQPRHQKRMSTTKSSHEGSNSQSRHQKYKSTTKISTINKFTKVSDDQLVVSNEITTAQSVDPVAIFRSNLYRISTAIESDVLSVSLLCVSEGLINTSILDYVHTVGLTNRDKASKLVMDIFNQLKASQDKNHYFLKVLNGFEKLDNLGLGEIIKQMRRS